MNTARWTARALDLSRTGAVPEGREEVKEAWERTFRPGLIQRRYRHSTKVLLATLPRRQYTQDELEQHLDSRGRIKRR